MSARLLLAETRGGARPRKLIKIKWNKNKS